MSRRLPLRIEATIDAVADTAAARRWAWAADTALYAHALLPWRDHRDVVTLHSPADSYDPDALAWALGHRPGLRTRMQLLTDRALVPIDIDGQTITATLRTMPAAADSDAWTAQTCVAHVHPGSGPQWTTSPAVTHDHVIARWTADGAGLDATIDAVALAETVGTGRFLELCHRLPGPVLARARSQLTLLDAVPADHLAATYRPAEQAAIRTATVRLDETLRSRGRRR